MEDFGYIKDEEQSKFSGTVKKAFMLGATLFSIACFIYVTINAYYFVYQDEGGEIETIKSPEGAIKVTEDLQQQASSDGSVQIDRTIYEDIFGNKNKAQKQKQIIAKLRNSPEPALPPKQKSDDRLIKEGSLISESPVRKETSKNSEQKIIVFSENDKKEAPTKDLLSSSSANQEKAKTPVKLSENKKRTIRVQVAALTSKSSAEEYWNKISRLHGSLFSGLKYFIEEVNLGKRGIFYRLQIGNFFNQVDAEEFCNRYVSQVQKNRADCIIVE